MNLLITGAWQDAAAHLDEIRAMGHAVLFLQQERDPLPCPPEWVEGVVCNGLFLYHPIERFVNLRYIQLTSAGYDRVPMDYIQVHGIEIHNARGVYSVPMAEFAVAGVLALYKGLPRFWEQQKEHRWEKQRDLRELFGSTVVIVGCGSVGTECAKRFRAFGCTVIGVDIAVREDPFFETILPLDSLDGALARADVVILTVPLTDATRGLIDARRLALISGQNGKNGILVNIARGPVVDRQALETWNGSAVLDVFDDEPLVPDSPLWGNHNFIITPHNSFVGDGNRNRIDRVIVRNLGECNTCQ